MEALTAIGYLPTRRDWGRLSLDGELKKCSRP
jgi:hypothetical protein